MAQRGSGYETIDGDKYYTPAWVVRGLLKHWQPAGNAEVWECAAGEGHMSAELTERGYRVHATDIDAAVAPPTLVLDFLRAGPLSCDGRILTVVTNPPYGKGNRLALAFVRHALEVTRRSAGSVAMLLPSAIDFRKTDRDLFDSCPTYAGRVVLLDRIRWVNLPQKLAGPSADHAWHVWEHLAERRARFRATPVRAVAKYETGSE